MELGYFSQVPTWFVYEIFFLRLKVGNLHLGFRGVKLLLVKSYEIEKNPQNPHNPALKCQKVPCHMPSNAAPAL